MAKSKKQQEAAKKAWKTRKKTIHLTFVCPHCKKWIQADVFGVKAKGRAVMV